MKISKHEELKKLAEPLREWLASNYNPMFEIVIDDTGATVNQKVLHTTFYPTIEKEIDGKEFAKAVAKATRDIVRGHED